MAIQAQILHRPVIVCRKEPSIFDAADHNLGNDPPQKANLPERPLCMNMLKLDPFGYGGIQYENQIASRTLKAADAHHSFSRV